MLLLGGLVNAHGYQKRRNAILGGALKDRAGVASGSPNFPQRRALTSAEIEHRVSFSICPVSSSCDSSARVYFTHVRQFRPSPIRRVFPDAKERFTWGDFDGRTHVGRDQGKEPQLQVVYVRRSEIGPG